MAPMARRAADRQQYRPVLALGARQGFITPGVPVDRIGGVLLQIRARFARESIHDPSGRDFLERRAFEVGAALYEPRHAKLALGAGGERTQDASGAERTRRHVEARFF